MGEIAPDVSASDAGLPVTRSPGYHGLHPARHRAIVNLPNPHEHSSSSSSSSKWLGLLIQINKSVFVRC